MPNAPMRLCLGCRRLTDGASRCPACKAKHERATNKRDERAKRLNQDADAHRFYRSKAWLACRRAILQERILCADCKAINVETVAVDVHHDKPRATHPELAYEPSNLVALCKRCHTRRENKERPTRRKHDCVQ